MNYERPKIELLEAVAELLSASELIPGATDIGSPSVSDECKSVWDEVNDIYNINKEEQDYEVHD